MTGAQQPAGKFGKSARKMLEPSRLVGPNDLGDCSHPSRMWLGQLMQREKLGRPMEVRFPALGQALPTVAQVHKIDTVAMLGTSVKGQSRHQAQPLGTHPNFFLKLSTSRHNWGFAGQNAAAGKCPDPSHNLSALPLLQTHLRTVGASIQQHDVHYRVFILPPRL